MINHIDDTNEDVMLFVEQQKKCLDLMISRNERYGDSYKKLRLNSIIDLMVMKLDRCVKQELDDKSIEVELEDIANYAMFGLILIRNKGGKQ